MLPIPDKTSEEPISAYPIALKHFFCNEFIVFKNTPKTINHLWFLTRLPKQDLENKCKSLQAIRKINAQDKNV